MLFKSSLTTGSKIRLRNLPGGPSGGVGSIPDGGAKIPQSSGPKNQNIKQKQDCNKFNKNLKIHIEKKILKKN